MAIVVKKYYLVKNRHLERDQIGEGAFSPIGEEPKPGCQTGIQYAQNSESSKYVLLFQLQKRWKMLTRTPKYLNKKNIE